MDCSRNIFALHVHVHGGSSHNKGTLTVANKLSSDQDIWDALHSVRNVLRALDGNVVRAHGGTVGALSFFRAGVAPAWEDASVANGCILRVALPAPAIVQAFESTALLLNAPIKHVEDLVGTRAVKSRAGEFRIELWSKRRVSEVASFGAFIAESCGVTVQNASVQHIPAA